MIEPLQPMVPPPWANSPAPAPADEEGDAIPSFADVQGGSGPAARPAGLAPMVTPPWATPPTPKVQAQPKLPVPPAAADPDFQQWYQNFTKSTGKTLGFDQARQIYKTLPKGTFSDVQAGASSSALPAGGGREAKRAELAQIAAQGDVNPGGQITKPEAPGPLSAFAEKMGLRDAATDPFGRASGLAYPAAEMVDYAGAALGQSVARPLVGLYSRAMSITNPEEAKILDVEGAAKQVRGALDQRMQTARDNFLEAHPNGVGPALALGTEFGAQAVPFVPGAGAGAAAIGEGATALAARAAPRLLEEGSTAAGLLSHAAGGAAFGGAVGLGNADPNASLGDQAQEVGTGMALGGLMGGIGGLHGHAEGRAIGPDRLQAVHDAFKPRSPLEGLSEKMLKPVTQHEVLASEHAGVEPAYPGYGGEPSQAFGAWLDRGGLAPDDVSPRLQKAFFEIHNPEDLPREPASSYTDGLNEKALARGGPAPVAEEAPSGYELNVLGKTIQIPSLREAPAAIRDAIFKKGARDAEVPGGEQGRVPEAPLGGPAESAPGRGPEAQAPAEPAAEVPAAEAAPGRVAGFRTAKGSTYETSGDVTSRLKATTGESFPSSQRTVYLTPEVQAEVMNAARAAKLDPSARSRVVQFPDGRMGLGVFDRATGEVRPSSSIAFPYETEPQVGLHPLEIFDASGSRGYHVGHAITEIRAEPRIEPMITPPWEAEGAPREEAHAQVVQPEEPMPHASDVRQEGDAARIPVQHEAAKGQVAPPPEQPATGIKNAVVAAERTARGLNPEVEVEMRRSIGSAWEAGKEAVDNGTRDPRKLARELAKNPRPLTAEEIGSLVYDRARLGNEVKATHDAIEKATAVGDEKAAAQGRLHLVDLMDHYNENDYAARRTGYEQGLGLRARQMMAREDYSLANVEQRARVAGGATAGERAHLAKLSKELEAGVEQHRAYQEGAAARESEKAIAAMKKDAAYETRKTRRAVTKEQLGTEFESLQKEFAKKAGKLHAGVDPELAVVMTKMAKNRVRAGLTTAEEVVDSIYQVVRHHVEGITPRDVRDAISGYGVVREPSKVELNRNLAEVNRQMRLLSALEDAQRGERPARSGFIPESPSPRVIELRRQVAEAMDAAGVGRTTEAQRIRAAEVAISKQIRDAEERLAGKPPVEKRPPPQSEKLDQLRARRNELRQQIKDAATGDEANLKRIRSAEAAVERSIAEIKSRLAGEPAPEKAPPAQSGRLDELRASRDDLRRQLRESAAAPKDPEQQRIKAAEAAVSRQIAAIQDRLAGKPAPEKTAPAKSDNLDVLRGQRDALREQLKAATAKPPKDPEVARQEAWKKQLTKAQADMQKQLADKSFKRYGRQPQVIENEEGKLVRVTRRPYVMDAENTRLKIQNERTKLQIDNTIKRIENRTKGPLSKTYDKITKIRRAIVLSSLTTTPEKIAAAAGWSTFVSTPIRSIVNLGLSHVPLMKQIAERAPREGVHSFGQLFGDEMKAFGQAFKKETWADVKEAAKTGHSSLDLLYDKKGSLPHEHLDMFGHFHAALKTLPKRAEFARAFSRRMEWARREGQDISSEAVQEEAGAGAYIEATRAVFMNDNLSTQGYQMVLHFLRAKDAEGLVTALQVGMPIVKVPTNYAISMMEYGAGGVRASWKLMKSVGGEVTKNIRGLPKGQRLNALPQLIFSRGLDGLKGEDADYIMRNASKGTMGAILFAIGYHNAENVGGFYRKDGRDETDVRNGDVRLWGVDFPHMVLHEPGIEMMQMGATFRRVQEEYASKQRDEGYTADELGSPNAEALRASAKSMAQSIPFFDQPTQAMEALHSTGSAQKFAGSLLRSATIPVDIGRSATIFDQDPQPGGRDTTKQILGWQHSHPIKRAPKSIFQEWETGIPGLRQRVKPKDE